MLTAIKVIILVAIVLLFVYPFIFLKNKFGVLFPARRLRYEAPKTRKNFIFIFLAIAEIILLAFIFKIFDKISEIIYSIPFVSSLMKSASGALSSKTHYIILAIKAILINIIAIYAFLILKGFIKKFLIDLPDRVREVGLLRAIFGKKKKSKKKKKAENDPDEEPEEETKTRKKRRIPLFEHTKLSDVKSEDDPEKKNEEGKNEGDAPIPKPRGRFTKWFLSLFFEGDDFEYTRGWVFRTRAVLNIFCNLTLILYILFFTSVLTSCFFKMPMFYYDFLIDTLRMGDWYLYPFLSVLLIREICNCIDLPIKDHKLAGRCAEEAEKIDDIKRNAKIRKLLGEIKKRFDTEHYLRYYPEVESDKAPEYECTSVMYKSALEYIKNQMKESSGHVVQSYMEFLDAVYNDDHTYFSASFYSELGEYLIAYTYIRLMSGARQVFVVSDPAEKETLRTYISDRLMKMTGSSPNASWRVYTAEERLEQADVLIATPEDFVLNDIAERHPDFFEEVCNAIFIDADKLIALDGYLCPIMATRLKNATDGRIRFVFLTLNLLKGFAAGSLPRFFCVDKVLSFSSAKENESSSCILWNKESKKHRIYNKNGQKSACLETIIAEQACLHGVDGVRLITESPIEHAERNVLARHNVEINNFYKDVVDVNYMIYSDNRCNLSAALYACMRFRGKKKSVVHIISKPYLLREYFASKAITEDHINRSSFIQPRVTEHVDRHKLSLLRILCDATFEVGIPVSVFEERVRRVIRAAIDRKDNITSAFCKDLIERRPIEEMRLSDLAAYLVAGICDCDKYSTDDEKKNCIEDSIGIRAKNYYIVVDSSKNNGFATFTEKYIIFNRVKDILKYILSSNRRVELRLNDEVVGKLDTFASRVHLEYVEGQSLIYNNSEYEIDHISDDGSAIYLRQENISIKNCLDTVILRHYSIGKVEEIGNSAVLDNSQSILREIRVAKCRMELEATTFGFYSLTSDRQTLDFYRGVEGNLNFDKPKVRKYAEAKALHVALRSRGECNDGMRRLLAAVFNEFIKTLFPDAYHCIAIVPVLSEPKAFDLSEKNGDPLVRIETLYPFLNSPTEEFIETEADRIQFYIINDSVEDVGVLDWFYDHSARYMQEFLANIYSYLHWLKLRPESNHYIYFGGKSLPECYDLDGLCELLGELNLILSDSGLTDIETAGDDLIEDKLEYCSFCHKLMESGRYTFFDDHRLICSECFDIVTERERLESIYALVVNYLAEHYSDIIFPNAAVEFDEVYDLEEGKELSEYYYRVDHEKNAIHVELDEPANNVFVSIMRGLIAMWQVGNDLANHYGPAQLYFEEIKYLRSIGENVSADWVYNNIPDHIREYVDEIDDFVKGIKKDVYADDEAEDTESEEAPEETPDAPEETPDEENKKDEGADDPARTSFAFMRQKRAELLREEENDEDPTDEEFSNKLFNPNKIPRFWKKYLLDETADDGKEEDTSEAVEDGDPEEGDEPTPDTPDTPDAPETEDDSDGEDEATEESSENGDLAPTPSDETDEPADTEPEEAPEEAGAPVDKKLEKQRKKEEKKRIKEEKRKKKLLAWANDINDIVDEENEQRRQNGLEPIDYSGKKKPDKDDSEEGKKKEKKPIFSIFKKKKKDEEPTEDKPEENKDEGEPTGNEIPDTPKDPEDPKDKPSDSPEDESSDETDEPKDPSDESEDPTDPSDESEDPSDKKKKKEKKPKEQKKKKPQKRAPGKKGKLTEGEKIVPYDEREATMPKLRLYNDLVRAAYNYSEYWVSREGVTNEEIERIILYITFDYPELFWVQPSWTWTDKQVKLKFRCRDANDNFDLEQVKKKHREIRKAALQFTKGITRNTKPYDALLTIYRRLILTLDYDGIGLNNGIDKDTSRDDPLRSLYGALVEHKVVCAGYARTMQYLLQSVGIVCAYVTSDEGANGTHAFNILKLGKFLYYLDATWGDPSNNLRGKKDSDVVNYPYFCVPYHEFLRTPAGWDPYHTPNSKIFPNFDKKIKYMNHEYHRYFKAYITSYNEDNLVRIFSEAALRYDKREMGCFTVSIRCVDTNFQKCVMDHLYGNGRMSSIIERAKTATAKKNKKAAKLFERAYTTNPDYSGVITVVFETPPSKKDKKKKK